MLDAIERIEIFIRSLIAYEMGKSSPMAYEDSSYIDPYYLSKNGGKSKWDHWQSENSGHICRSHEDYILWHQQAGKQIPIWVVVEVWDFGLMSRYFSMLKTRYKNKICARISPIITPKDLNNWLRELNTLRNRCAHHTRIWNQVSNTPLAMPSNIDYFNKNNLSSDARKRLCGMISVIWFFLHKIGANSEWLKRVTELIYNQAQKPYFKVRSMGFMDETLTELASFKNNI